VAPLRRIQGPKTGLNWPMAISVDADHDEIAVANSGDSSIRIFSRKKAQKARKRNQSQTHGSEMREWKRLISENHG